MKILVQPPKPQSSYSGLYTRHRVEGVGFGVVFGGAWGRCSVFLEEKPSTSIHLSRVCSWSDFRGFGRRPTVQDVRFKGSRFGT